MVGDRLREDVGGAQAVGLDVYPGSSGSRDDESGCSPSPMRVALPTPADVHAASLGTT